MKHESTNEPVAWITNNGDGWLRWHRTADNNLNSIPLYTHPQDKRKDEALRLALEALKNSIDLVSNEAREAESLYGKYPSRLARVQGLVALEVDHQKAITLIEQALENK